MSHAQNAGAIRFFGSGSDSNPNRDRVNIQIDDNVAGTAGNTIADVGNGSFTIEFWIRGNLADNTSTTSLDFDASHAGIAWTEGNVVVDRDIYTTTSQPGDHRDWGISILQGRVAFGTGYKNGPGADTEATLLGSTLVLDGAWNHIAVVRNASTGAKSIFVNGVLDISLATHPSNDDLSFPDAGLTNNYSAFNNFLVLGAEKHDYPGSKYFNGFFDELRLWNVARTQAEIAADYNLVISGTTPNLVGYWRFEEASGTTVTNEVATSPSGTLINNTPGNGLRVFYSENASNTAPLIPEPSTAALVLSALLFVVGGRRRSC